MFNYLYRKIITLILIHKIKYLLVYEAQQAIYDVYHSVMRDYYVKYFDTKILSSGEIKQLKDAFKLIDLLKKDSRFKLHLPVTVNKLMLS